MKKLLLYTLVCAAILLPCGAQTANEHFTTLLQRFEKTTQAREANRFFALLHAEDPGITEQFFEQLPQHPELLPWIKDNLVGAQNIDLQQLAKTEPSEPVGNFLNKLLVELNHSAQ